MKRQVIAGLLTAGLLTAGLTLSGMKSVAAAKKGDAPYTEGKKRG